MRTFVSGLEALRRAPLAAVPIIVEGVVGGFLVAVGLIPATGASATASAVFPLDLFFDVKQSLASARGWPTFVILVTVAVVARSSVLAATVWLADERKTSSIKWWRDALRLGGTAALALFPGAALFFIGVAARYAPFVWAATLLTFVPALLMLRRAISLGRPVRSVPGIGGYLAYGYGIAVIGAAMSSLAGITPLAAAAVLICVSPLHALLFLGWREHALSETYPGGGAFAVGVAVVLILLIVGGTVYDRYVRTPPPVAETRAEGSLLLLGGVDSTLTTGALAGLDPRQVGFDEKSTTVLSYRGPDLPSTREDTHTSLVEVARAVSRQIARATQPTHLLGHSQAGLIVDRIQDRGIPGPDRSAVISDPPPFPPPLDIPAPNEAGVGKPGGDIARTVAKVLSAAGFESYQVDSPSFPTNLDPVVVIDSRVPRLSVWALGDSVWLDRDWRRPGEMNIVALTDHVGATNDAHALDAIKRFFMEERLEDDEVSWQGGLVAVIRHLFAPWRPAIVP